MVWDIQAVLAVCGGIVLIGNAGAALHRFLSPVSKFKKKVECHDAAIKDLKEKLERDYKKLQEIQELNKAQTKCMIDMMNHAIDGNHVQNMKDTREEATKLLAEL